MLHHPADIGAKGLTGVRVALGIDFVACGVGHCNVRAAVLTPTAAAEAIAP